MNWFSRITDAIAAAGDYVEQHNKSVADSHVDLFATIIRNHSLSCGKCNSLAVPILDTKNIYKCNNCGRQFTQSRHSIRSSLYRSIMEDYRSKDENYITYIYEKAISKI